MSYVMQVAAFANGAPCRIRRMFLRTFDFEAYRGQGMGDFTRDPLRAMKFKDQVEAMDFWNTQSKTVPLRPDGMPNKPLTSTTMHIAPLGDFI